MSVPPLSPDALSQIYREAAAQGTGTKYGVLAALTVLAYDAMTTFSDEVELIWKRSFSAVTYIYFMNRYYAIAVAFISFLENILPVFGGKRMEHFQPFAVGIPLTFFPDMIIGLRVYALYERNKLLGMFLVTYLLGELGVALWIYLTPSLDILALPGPESITNSLALHACEPITTPRLSAMQAASFQFMQTIFDTIALVLILAKTYREILKVKTLGGIKAVIAKHGVLYYVVVFSVNLAWAIMILVATNGLKYSMAGPTLGLAPMAANKLTLSLRAYSAPKSISPGLSDPPELDNTKKRKRRGSWVGTSTFEFSDGRTSTKSAEDQGAIAYELDSMKEESPGLYSGWGEGVTQNTGSTRTFVA